MVQILVLVKVLSSKPPPKIAIISTNGRYGHPSVEVLERLQSNGTKIYRTDKNHTLWITSNGYEIKIDELDYNLDGTR